MTNPPAWPFDDPPNTACITCASVLAGEDWIQLAVREDDGWQFIPSAGICNEADAKVVGLGSMFTLDPSLAALNALGVGEHAARESASGEWEVVSGE